MTANLKQRIRGSLRRDLIIDLLDVAVARTRDAFELVRDGTDLSGKSARALEGQARFRMMEKGFQTVCEAHGGALIEGGIFPGTDLRFYQPFMRFGQTEPGVVLGFASMPAPRELPVKNKSRTSGVFLNCHLTPRLDLNDGGAKIGDIFTLLLVARDPARAGHVAEVAMGVIDSAYGGYLFYEPIEDFLAGYADVTDNTDPGSPDAPAGSSLVKLRKDRKVYRAPENPAPDEESGEAS